MQDHMMHALKKRGVHVTISVDKEPGKEADHMDSPQLTDEPSVPGMKMDDALDENDFDPSASMNETDKAIVMGKKKTSLHEKMQKHALTKKMEHAKV